MRPFKSLIQYYVYNCAECHLCKVWKHPNRKFVYRCHARSHPNHITESTESEHAPAGIPDWCPFPHAPVTEQAPDFADRKIAPVQGQADPIPWVVHLRAYEVYASKFGKSQSAERIAERGGFHVDELDKFIPGWRREKDGIEDG